MPVFFLAVAAIPELAAVAILATLQGLTEFLPISSSGHLVLAEAALGLTEPGLTLEIVVHLGTLVSVLLVYRRDIQRLLAGLFEGAWREPMLVVVATLPTVWVGLVHGDQVSELFGSPRFAAKALFGTAGILLAGEWARRRNLARAVGDPSDTGTRPLEHLRGQLPGWWGALLIGLAQSVAVLPGISRSGSTIAVGLLIGLAPRAAARFSFLMAIPAILGAAILKLPEALEQGHAAGAGAPGQSGLGLGSLAFAAGVSALVGWLALRLLLSFLGRGAFAWFAIYCVLLGGVALITL